VAGFYGQSVGRRLSISVGKCATIFQTEVYAILACVYEIQMKGTPEKYVSICSDSEEAVLPERLHWYESAKRR
jgi:hypothetical protein